MIALAPTVQNEDLVIRGDLKHASSIGGAMRIALLALGLLLPAGRNRAKARSGMSGIRLSILCALLCALLLPALTRSAMAQSQITFTSAIARWHDPTDDVPGVQPGDPVITNGVPTSSINWGTTSGTPQSGYDVTITIPDPQKFPVATFAHRNFPISPPSLTSVLLDIVLDFQVDGVQTGPLTFTFTFHHEETPNNLDPCPYPTPPGEGCTDRVTIIDLPNPTTFTVGGKTYTLSLRFLDANGNPVSEFITREGGLVNTANLDGQFVLVPPVLEVTKSGPAAMTVGQSGTFAIDVRNTGPNDAWNATIRDVLPRGATGGMCDSTPQVLSAQVFAADGVTPVPGKPPLLAGTDFTLSYAGAPTCELSLAMLTPAAAIGTDQRLIITYRTQVDAGSQGGATLTNVAGATQWFDADSSDPNRVTYTRTLTDGTPGVLDFQDAHTVTVGQVAYRFEKTVIDLTSGANPATSAAPGDRLRYRLRLENLGADPLPNLSIYDELDAMNNPPGFQAGTLQLVTVPLGADTSQTSGTGGPKGTGVVDIRNLSLPGVAGSTLVVEFEITLAPVLANGSTVANQSRLRLNGADFALSDDPNVNGQADPLVTGDEDPTRVRIVSAPAFRVQKVSADLTGDPNILLAGETLRYTITVKNIGNANAVNVTLRDAIPVNTHYLPGSTTLNGTLVPDGPSGTAPLAAGILIHAPEDPTPGAMRADASATPNNVATLVFEVAVDAGVVDGTVISNQGFVSAVAAGVVDQPSDDPRTPVPDDPTRNVVGSSPLLFAPKTVQLLVDAGTPGIVDPGDVLHYTITVYNSGAVAATHVVLTDSVPANTTYIADSTTLNGLPVGQPDGGTSPLIAGVPISSSDLTPPLPGAGAGTLSPGHSAVVGFNVQVDAGVPAGTIISNQGVVHTNELPNLPTDGDGNPSTGPEPTVVVVGNGQQLAITKQVAVVGGGAALAGSQLEYVVRVVNVAAVPAYNVVLTDDLDAATPGALTYVAASATLNGSAAGVSVLGSIITADYSTPYGPLQPGASIVLRFRAVLNANLATGTTVTNTGVVTWNTPTQTASASVSIGVGGMPGVAVLNGTVWHDANFDNALSGSERVLPGWIVDLYRNATLLKSVVTEAAGTYRVEGLTPNQGTGDRYALRFRAPDAGASSAKLGRADSPFTNGLQEITDIVVASGANLQNLNLPLDPNGVVYASIARTPVAGATLTLLNASSRSPLPSLCFDDPVQQGQVTRSDGYYKFDLNFSDAACPSGGSYIIAVTPPGSGFSTGYSRVIPPTTDPSTPPLDVPTCPGTASDAVPSTSQYCEAQPSEFAPPSSVRARTAGTTYYVNLQLDGSRLPGSSQIFDNHIPLDPVLEGLVGITKTTPSVNVSRGQLVPYEITVTSQPGLDIPDLSIVDRVPAGFRYVKGSAQIDGVKVEPTVNGNQLLWADVGTSVAGPRKLLLLLAVGAGVSEGEFVNRAQAISSVTGAPLSGEATATVRVVPDPTFDCTDVLGKVFDDANQNGVQDEGERGLQGVRVATVRGLVATTDRYGRFHITCAIVPREDRGSNFSLKLDDRTLPSGYRMTTRQVQVKRATAGKALLFDFGASIQRVVGLDLVDAVFEPDTTEMRLQWKPRIELLLAELAKGPAILRLSYIADLEDAKLVDRRLQAVKKEIAQAWQARQSYPLTIEVEVFWRRGAPQGRPGMHVPGVEELESLLPSVDAGPPVVESQAGESAERLMSIDQPFQQWSQDPALLKRQLGDTVEKQEVHTEQAKTVKLKNVVPPIHFESGVANIPPSTVAKLRSVLDGMRDLKNVRLHLVGHADSQPLSPALSRVFGDNEGLSEERAGQVAEFLKAALALPPEAITFAWAGDSDPIATNSTPEGRALNRRVEVEVWYDETEEKISSEDVVVPAEIKRVKVCRTETVCKLRYLEGHARRARVRNLIAPLHFGEDAVDVPEEFIRQVEQALHDLRDKQHVTVKFIGFADDAPLSGREERIYGTSLALSKARAHRVALAVQDALHLPTSAIESDGLGAARPIASNATERGRALNRRVEVEFWHDDPLQELPDEPQLCPDAPGAEVVTKVYEPPWGSLAPLPIEGGEAQIPPGYGDALRRALADVADRTHPRLRFVGYTRNERLDRRTALVYGDDIGLSAARARRAMEKIQAQLGLSDAQVEHEGRGYVHSDDVVNAGFVQGDSSYVVVQVVYDELAVQDDNEGVDVKRITREITPKEPLALNPMRITVDGVPIDDPGRSVADIQRCTDVALERADIQFRFDNLSSEPRLGVTSDPIAAPFAADGTPASTVRFRMYTNYAPFIERSEVRIFEQEQSLEAQPLGVVPIGPDGVAEWQPPAGSFTGPVRKLKFVVRAYDKEGHFDETRPQSLWQTYEGAQPPRPEQLLAGYGEGEPLARNIPLGSAGTVHVHGSGIPPQHTVWVAGAPVPVDDQGNFVGEVILPAGAHTVEVAVLDPAGNGELFLRDLEFKKSDWFYTAIADLTVATDLSGKVPSALQGKHAPFDPDSTTDGRLAFYLNGKFGEDWKLTASADTREEPLQDMFTNFLDKAPDSLFRRIDPDYHYPTFGDDSRVDETAPTQGKFYARLSKDESHALWGNFKVDYHDNELGQVERGLYGANVHYQTLSTTRFGEKRLSLDGFAAEPGTVPSREEFRGTDGSLYYLHRQDILVGSERVWIEVRDKDSQLVTGVVNLKPQLDYDIDYLQGRILLTEPLSAVVSDNLLIRSGGLSGNDAFLVVQYEYTPGFDQLNALAAGGAGHYWLNDFIKFGLTANRNEGQGDGNSTLYAGDVTVRASTDSWVKLQAGRSEGLVSSTLVSEDGGFQFFGTGAGTLTQSNANAYRVDVSVGVADFIEHGRGRLSLYAQRLEAGYSAPGQTALTDTDHLGGTLSIPVTDKLELSAKGDWRAQDHALETRVGEVDAAYKLTDHWSVGTGVRDDKRKDDSQVVAPTQEEGERTDAVVQVGYDAKARWRAYGFGQATVAKSGDREDNNRGGVGGSFRLSDRLLVDGEVSEGNLGPAVKLGTSFQQSQDTNYYLSYAYGDERGYDGFQGRRGNLISGVKTRLSDSSSVYMEDRYQHGDAGNGLLRTMGMSLAPSDHWNLGANWELGNLFDAQTNAETKRKAGGVRFSYGFDRLQLSSGIEYRYDETEQLDKSWDHRTTWLFRNNFRFQIDPDGRVVGKFNHSFSDSSQGDFYNGGYTEAVIGYAYRPVANDRLNALLKYTYFYNVPTTDQVTLNNTPAQFIQKSHVASLDVTYDLTRSWSIGGKYAYRLAQVSLDRSNPDFFDNNAHLFILRTDYRFLEKWEGSVEGRLLDLTDLNERRGGAALTLYRYLGDHFKVGVGYNFTDFSDDLTDLSYDHHGVFFNVVGSM